MRLILDFPDSDYEFYMDLFKKLGSNKILVNNTMEPLIAREHETITSDRISNSKQEDLVDWEDAMRCIKIE